MHIYIVVSKIDETSFNKMSSEDLHSSETR